MSSEEVDSKKKTAATENVLSVLHPRTVDWTEKVRSSIESGSNYHILKWSFQFAETSSVSVDISASIYLEDITVHMNFCLHLDESLNDKPK